MKTQNEINQQREDDRLIMTGSVALFVFLATFAAAMLLASCSLTPAPRLSGDTGSQVTSNEQVRSDWRPCSLPIQVYVPAGTSTWEESALWTGFDRVNEESGLTIFVRMGHMRGKLVRSYAPGHGRAPVVLAQFLDPELLDEAIGRPFTESYDTSGLFRRSAGDGCFDTGWIAINNLLQIRPDAVEAVVTHEAIHSCGGLDQDNVGSIMNWQMSIKPKKSLFPLYNPTTVPQMSIDDIKMIQQIYSEVNDGN